MLADPFLIEGPALISFSGGRTSAYMLHRMLRSYGGSLPSDVVVTFANTGKEMPETLDFVQEVSERFNVPVIWLEWRWEKEDGVSFEVVNHNMASRAGEPFERLCRKKGYLPNPVTRFCTFELKIRVMRDYARSLGWDHWTNIVGLRADEPHRVVKARARSESGKEPWETETPLYTAGVTKRAVFDFWNAAAFDLRLENVGGSTPLGNCDLCFLKAMPTRLGIMRERPELAEWWIQMEQEIRASKKSGALFRFDQPSYSELFNSNLKQGDLLAGWADDAGLPCMCTD